MSVRNLKENRFSPVTSFTTREGNMNRADCYNQIIGELSSSKNMLEHVVDLVQSCGMPSTSDVNAVGEALQNADKSLGSSIDIVEKLSNYNP